VENREWRMECGRGCLGFNGTNGTDGTDGTGVGGDRPQEDPKGFGKPLGSRRGQGGGRRYARR
jgi:hypothetical protein